MTDKEYSCVHCGRKFGKSQALKGHISHCKPTTKRDKSRSPGGWNKGLSKETCPSMAKNSETQRRNYKEGKQKSWSKGKTKETDARIAKASKRISKTLQKKVREGTWHLSFSKARTYDYKGLKLYGTWELAYAKYLDEKGIEWRRPEEKFFYRFEGKRRTYTPDFFLVAEGLYVEIKGYPTPKDEAKWSQFPHKLLVLYGKDLHEMGLIDNYKEIEQIKRDKIEDAQDLYEVFRLK